MSEPMFKKGDRVVRTGPSIDDWDMVEGETYTVGSASPGHVAIEGHPFSYDPAQFEHAAPEFKPGDIVDAHRDIWDYERDGTLRPSWAWAKGLIVVRVLAGNVWTADYPGGPTTRSFYPSALTHAFPRKPNKADVKPGDTVTLTRPVTSVVPATYSRTFEGTVDAVLAHADGSIGFSIAQMTFYLGEHWTLTDHQPKPKPFGHGTALVDGIRYRGFVTRFDRFNYLNPDGSHDSSGEYSDFRPDVVEPF